ncbi:hypothetical protein PoB_007514200 [Plakobranchus ocellatus]|uniref:Uncharacterized protein n=1 Tax=Plakobranchus ocellatus TaxID=259542 RepID=A0AAV4DX91_9GAST|nr:hypothetical protein PoB_007514200 [Plakobranchus ocellatus]
MSRRDGIAFYSSQRNLPLRRYSEPSSTCKISNTESFASKQKPFRRFSFSALENYCRKGDGRHGHRSGLQDIDLTPLGVRNQVDQVLQDNGFKDSEKLKVAQFRYYSNHVEKDIVNPLKDQAKRGSFAAIAAAAVCDKKNQKDSEISRTGSIRFDTGVRSSRSFQSIQKGPVRVSRGQHRFANRFANAWESTEYEPDNRYLVDNNSRHHSLSMADMDDHLIQKKSLWTGRCRRDSISKFRNRVMDALRPYTETDTEYWRRCRSLNCDEELSKFPKCKYRLREDGLIASELASATKVDIDDRNLEYGDDNDNNSPRNSFARPASAMATTNKADILSNLIKFRRKSSLLSDSDTNHKAAFHRSLSSYSDKTISLEVSDKSSSHDPSFQRSLSCQDSVTSEEEYRRPFFHPMKCISMSPQMPHISDTEAYLATRRAAMRGSTAGKRRWSQTTSEGFELIGSPSLHGAPRYKGRLMLLTARTVRFNDEFNEGEIQK